MRLSEADAGKIFWRVLRGFAAAHGDLMPPFAETPLELRSAVTQTASEVMDSDNEKAGEVIVNLLLAVGWTAGRYDATAKTISLAQDPQNITIGIAAGLRAASCSLIALKEI